MTKFIVVLYRMRLERKHRYLLSVLSGLLLGLSFPYIGSAAPLAFIALIPLLIIEEQVYRNKYRAAKVFIHAYVCFFFYNLTATWWIYYASEGGMLMAVLANSFIMAFPIFFFHWTKKKVGVKEGYIGLLFYWLAFEYGHYYWELSWPWLSFGNVFANWTPLVQWYEWTGVTGGTLWVLLGNLLAFQIVKNIYIKRDPVREQKKLFYLFIFTIIVPIVVSLSMYYSFDENTGKQVNVVSIQPNIDPYKKFDGISPLDQVQNIIDLGSSVYDDSVDIILAPETAIPFSINETELMDHPLTNPLIDWVNEMDGPTLVIGASTHAFFEKRNSPASRPTEDGTGFYEHYNTVLVIKPHEDIQRYHKSKLVLGVEHLPFAWLLGFLEDYAIDMGGTVGSLGIEEKPIIFKEPHPFTALVCYESVYGEFMASFSRMGSEAIYIITNDGWWRDTPGYRQHMAFSRLRAIENRKPLVRSANTGISCFINAKGDVVQEIGWWKKGVLKGTIYPNAEPTLYVQYGDFIGRSSVFVALALLLYAFIKALRQLGLGTPFSTKDSNSSKGE